MTRCFDALPDDSRLRFADFPWSLQHIMPFWSGAEHHDFHHMAFVNNFSTSFRWCDRIFGTDTKYRAYRARLDGAKKAGMSPEEYARMEAKLNEEAERDGIQAEQEAENAGFGGAWGAKKVKVQ